MDTDREKTDDPHQVEQEKHDRAGNDTGHLPRKGARERQYRATEYSGGLDGLTPPYNSDRESPRRDNRIVKR